MKHDLSELDWRRIWEAGLISTVVAALIIWIPARGHPANATFGDGDLYRYVARHLSSRLANLPLILTQRGPSLRYGRIGLPLMIWVFSLGSQGAMAIVQPLLMMLSAGVAGASLGYFLPGPIWLPTLAFLSLGYSASISGGFGEAPAIALALLSLVLVERRHLFLATIAMAMALITKESSFVVLGGLLIWSLYRRQWKNLYLAAAVIPYAVWGLIVRTRFGYFPLTDPWLRNLSLGRPGIALWQTWHGPLGSAVVAGVHALLACLAVFLLIKKRTLFGVIAALASIQVLVTAPVVWRYLGDGLRSVTFQEIFIIMTVVLFAQDRNKQAIPKFST